MIEIAILAIVAGAATVLRLERQRRDRRMMDRLRTSLELAADIIATRSRLPYFVVKVNADTGEVHVWAFDREQRSLQTLIQELGHAAKDGEIDWMDCADLSRTALEIAKEGA